MHVQGDRKCSSVCKSVCLNACSDFCEWHLQSLVFEHSIARFKIQSVYRWSQSYHWNSWKICSLFDYMTPSFSVVQLVKSTFAPFMVTTIIGDDSHWQCCAACVESFLPFHCSEMQPAVRLAQHISYLDSKCLRNQSAQFWAMTATIWMCHKIEPVVRKFTCMGCTLMCKSETNGWVPESALIWNWAFLIIMESFFIIIIILFTS